MNNTWKIVDRPPEAKIIGNKTVLRKKYTSERKFGRTVTRVVAQGFSQRSGIDFHDTFALVARLGSLKVLVGMTEKMNLNISQLDITTSYLDGKIGTEMKLPNFLVEILQRIIKEETDAKLLQQATAMQADFQEGNKVCKLIKLIYGLRQLGSQWHTELYRTLREMGLTPTKADPCVYVDKCYITYLLVYVDHILIITKNKPREQQIQQMLSRAFNVKDLGDAKIRAILPGD